MILDLYISLRAGVFTQGFFLGASGFSFKSWTENRGMTSKGIFLGNFDFGKNEYVSVGKIYNILGNIIFE